MSEGPDTGRQLETGPTGKKNIKDQTNSKELDNWRELSKPNSKELTTNSKELSDSKEQAKPNSRELSKPTTRSLPTSCS